MSSFRRKKQALGKQCMVQYSEMLPCPHPSSVTSNLEGHLNCCCGRLYYHKEKWSSLESMPSAYQVREIWEDPVYSQYWLSYPSSTDNASWVEGDVNLPPVCWSWPHLHGWARDWKLGAGVLSASSCQALTCCGNPGLMLMHWLFCRVRIRFRLLCLSTM